jgi:hypothetical protein
MDHRLVTPPGKWRLGRVLLVSLALGCLPAYAGYNANLGGNVASVLTYNSGLLLFSLANQPTSNGSCNASYFELDESVTADAGAFNRMYSRLLEAYVTGTPVNIGYDNGVACAPGGYIQAYRIG